MPIENNEEKIAISDAEWKIVNLLWESSPLTITQLTKKLEKDTGWSKNTIITYLKRLEAKDIIYHEEGERAKLFYVKVSKEETRTKAAKSFLDRVFKGNIGLMLSTMVDEKEVTDEEIEELYEILKNAKKD